MVINCEAWKINTDKKIIYIFLNSDILFCHKQNESHSLTSDTGLGLESGVKEFVDTQGQMCFYGHRHI